MSEDDDQRNEQKEVETSRRDFLKGSAVAASAGLAATTPRRGINGVGSARSTRESVRFPPGRWYQPAGLLSTVGIH